MPDARAVWRSRAFEAIGGAGYDFAVEHEWLARPAGRLLWDTDTARFYRSIAVAGTVPDGSAILDVPCGGGVALRALRPEQRLRYVAADISVSMLARARRRSEQRGLAGVEFVETDIERMPFPDREFDVCLCFNGLHCLPDPAAATREIARCLRPGGRLVGDCVVQGSGPRPDRFIALLRRAGVFGIGGTAGDLERWLTHAGLRVDQLDRSGAVAYFTATRPAA